MDRAWYYYSGQKSESFQYESDYGVELLYLATFARLCLSKFMDVTPGTLVFIVRWIHLFFWIASLWVVWRMVRAHFGDSWLNLYVVLLLAVRPSFPYFSENLKPEPMVLFFMILGLDHTLRLIDRPSYFRLWAAAACAAAAAAIKYAGFFLIPPIILALYFVKQSNQSTRFSLPEIRNAWLLPAVVGCILVSLPLILIFTYKQQVTGLSWFEEFGFLNALFRNAFMSSVFISGLAFVGMSSVLGILQHSENDFLKKLFEKLNTLFSISTVVLSFFGVSLILFCLGLFFRPSHFIQIAATIGPEAHVSMETPAHHFLMGYVKHIVGGMKHFDVIILGLFFLYLFIIWRRVKKETLSIHFSAYPKHIILSFFVLLIVSLFFFPIRLFHHHLMPFFVAASVLVIQIPSFIKQIPFSRIWQRQFMTISIGILLTLCFVQNLRTSVSEFKYLYHWRQDVAFDIARWLEKTYPSDTPIVADHPARVYLPAHFKNKRRLVWQLDKIQQLQELIKSFKPRLIYYHESDHSSSLVDLLPNVRLKRIKSFDGKRKHYKRFQSSKFVIYEII